MLRNSWYSLYRTSKDERQSQPWSQQVVLNTGPLDLEFSTLTTKQFLQLKQKNCKSCKNEKNCKNESTKITLPHITSSPQDLLFFEIISQPLNHKALAPSTSYRWGRRKLCRTIPWQVDFTVSLFRMKTIFNV